MKRTGEGDEPTHSIVVKPDKGFYSEGADGSNVLLGKLYIGGRRLEESLSCTLPPVFRDLFDLTAAVYVADRLASRVQLVTRYEKWSSRRILLRLPMRESARWRSECVLTSLEQTLWFLTGDHWSFDFDQHPGDRPAQGFQPYLPDLQPVGPVTVSLFSGGLDSLAGFTWEFLDHPDDTFVLVAGSPNPRIAGVQRHLLHAIDARGRRARPQVIPARIPFGLWDRPRRGGEQQAPRSRGFVFPVLGAIAAMAAGANSLAIYENGIGAINLPCNGGQLATDSTRSAHPLNLKYVSGFIRWVTKMPFHIRNPFLLSTKAEMCARLAAGSSAGYEGYDPVRLITCTVSCDSFPQRVREQAQCGKCTPCLLRRQALFAAGLEEHDAVNYRVDITRPSESAVAGRLDPLRAMLEQCGRLQRCLASSDPWRALANEFSGLVDVADILAESQRQDAVKAQLVDLYRRYCDEWTRFPVRPPAWPADAA